VGDCAGNGFQGNQSCITDDEEVMCCTVDDEMCFCCSLLMLYIDCIVLKGLK